MLKEKLDSAFAFLQTKSPPLIGVDISSSALKLVELSETGKGSYRLERYAIEPKKVKGRTMCLPTLHVLSSFAQGRCCCARWNEVEAFERSSVRSSARLARRDRMIR